MPASDVNDLKALIGAPKTFTVKGKPYVVSEWTLRQYPEVMRIGKPMLPALAAGPAADLPAFIERFAGEIEELIALSTGQTVEWARSLSGVESLDGVATMLEVNSDFFSRAMKSILNRLLPHLIVAPIPGLSTSPAPSAPREEETVLPSSPPSAAGPAPSSS